MHYHSFHDNGYDVNLAQQLHEQGITKVLKRVKRANANNSIAIVILCNGFVRSTFVTQSVKPTNVARTVPVSMPDTYSSAPLC